VSSDFALYITRYGYVAIFLLVLLQELGVPNPVTNEFVLLFSGYLAFSGALSLWLVVLTAVSADCIGTTILYAVFYRFGKLIVGHPPRWLPVSPMRIAQVVDRISTRQQRSIYIGRLIPFLRGYVSVAAGILTVSPKIFIPAVVVSAITWSGGYVIAGRILGPYWEHIAARIGRIESLILLVTLIVIATLMGRAFIRKNGQPA
jgi:membrane protein DedA with SNARE-associated domain